MPPRKKNPFCERRKDVHWSPVTGIWESAEVADEAELQKRNLFVPSFAHLKFQKCCHHCVAELYNCQTQEK